MELHDRVAIVTGASRGIGRQLALALARHGTKVVVAARTVEPHARLVGSVGETVALIEAEGGQALAVACDLADPEQLNVLVETTVAHFGGIDVLVNNAADTQGQRRRGRRVPTRVVAPPVRRQRPRPVRAHRPRRATPAGAWRRRDRQHHVEPG